MGLNASDLFEVLTVVAQYENDAYIYYNRGVLFIDGYEACRKMTQYEKTVLKRLGFETGEKYGIRQITVKTKDVSK